VVISGEKFNFDRAAQRFSLVDNERRVRWMRARLRNTYDGKNLSLSKDGKAEEFDVNWEQIRETGKDGDWYLYTSEAKRVKDHADCLVTMKVLPPDTARLLTAAPNRSPQQVQQLQNGKHQKMNLLTGQPLEKTP
jgi:hypothetical protein